MSWCTIESDPGVFTELIEAFGVKDAEFAELYSMDDESVAALGKMHGAIFLFKYDSDIKDEREALDYAPGGGVFFMNQIINNACATQAIISILLNARGLEIGETLSSFRDFTKEFPPDLKGMALADSPEIRTAHNSFAKPEPFVIEEQKATKDDDVYHFIAYVPIDGTVYELDGLKKGPIVLGEVPKAADGVGEGHWFSAARPEIVRRIEAYSKSEIRFNLLALTESRKAKAEVDLAAAEAALAAATGAGGGGGGGAGAGAGGAAGAGAGAGADAGALEARVEVAKRTLADEVEKRRRWHVENVRRKHNYVPFIVELLRQMARKGKLDELRSAARDKAKDMAEKAAKRKREGGLAGSDSD